jgi:hypothetical protein
MAATVDMGVLSKSFRTALDETAGQFKRASNENSVNFNKIVKDIGGMFKAQRGDISELTNVVQESVSESQQAAAKIDSQNSLVREGLTLQSEMRDYLKTMASNIKTLNDSIVNMSNQMVSSAPNGLLGGLSTGIANALKVAGIGAGAVAGGAAINSLMGGGKGVGESGSSSEAMSFFQSKGWSKEQAAGIVGNLQSESGKNLRTDAVGDSGLAYGIAQWHPDRQAQFQKVMGIPIRQSSFKQQLEFVNWELNNSEAAAGRALRGAATAAEAASIVDARYERSTGAVRGQRMANATALVSGTQTTSSTEIKPKINQDEAPPPSATSPRYEGPGSGHGPVAGASHGEKVEGGLPHGDLLSLGKALQGMGLRVSEHPSFGGVRGVHTKNSAHYRGEAMDINIGEGNIEAQNPAMSAKFDQLAEQLKAAGYKVIWKAPGHYNHLHVQTGGGESGHETAASGTSGMGTAGAITPGSAGSAIPQTPISPRSAGSAVPQTPISPGVSAGMTGMDMSSMMGMMPMMGGGMGGMIGALMPMVGSLLGSLGGMGAPQGFDGQQSPITGMLQSLSESTSSIDMMNQTAIQRQAQQEYSQEMLATASEETSRGADSSIVNNTISGSGAGHGYNYPGDTGWPEWASMIGGNHWSEMKKYKQNMWG